MIKRSWSLKNFIRDRGRTEARRVMGYPEDGISDRDEETIYIVQTDYEKYSAWRHLKLLHEVDITQRRFIFLSPIK